MMTTAMSLLLAASTPAARLAAVRGRWAPGPVLSWTVWVPVLLGLALAVALIHVHRRWAAQRRSVQTLLETAGNLGLDREQRDLVMRVASLADVARFDAVLAVEEDFERGALRLMGSAPVAALPTDQRDRLAAALDGVRAQLGFRGGATGGVRLSRGMGLTVLPRGAEEGLSGVVSAVDDADVTVELDAETAPAPGESWVLRHVEGGVQWESSATVMRGIGRYVVLRLTGKFAAVNLRRFVRVPTARTVHLAAFPFRGRLPEDLLPEFVRGLLTEIAGPGLRIKSPLRPAVGDQVLVIVRMDGGEVLQGLARVRRAVDLEDGRTAAVVEMTGLSAEQEGRLIQETNAAARAAAGRQSDASAGTDAEAEPVGAAERTQA